MSDGVWFASESAGQGIWALSESTAVEDQIRNFDPGLPLAWYADAGFAAAYAFYQLGIAVANRADSTDGNVALTGVSATASAGSVASAAAYTLTGVSGTPAVGSVVAAPSQALTGVAGTVSVGTLVSVVSYAISGVQATVSVGDVSVPGDVTKAISGVSAAAEVGNLLASVEIADAGSSAGRRRRRPLSREITTEAPKEEIISPKPATKSNGLEVKADQSPSARAKPPALPSALAKLAPVEATPPERRPGDDPAAETQALAKAIATIERQAAEQQRKRRDAIAKAMMSAAEALLMGD